MISMYATAAFEITGNPASRQKQTTRPIATASRKDTAVSCIVFTAPSRSGGRNIPRSRAIPSSIERSVRDQVADTPAVQDPLELAALLQLRSEERRVGKECRSR